MKTHFLRVFFFILITACLANAQDVAKKQHPIDTKIDQLAEQDPSTHGLIRAYDKGYELWDQELNRVYKELMKALEKDETAKKALKESQMQWLKFRDAEFSYLKLLWSKKEGTMYIPMGVYSRLELVKQRALELSDNLSILSDQEPSGEGN